MMMMMVVLMIIYFQEVVKIVDNKDHVSHNRAFKLNLHFTTFLCYFCCCCFNSIGDLADDHELFVFAVVVEFSGV